MTDNIPPNDPQPNDPPADPPPNDPPADPPPADPPPAYFKSMPDDWRSQLAGDDEKRLKQLERVSDMDGLVNNYFSAQDMIRKGELSNGLPENPTDDQLSQWREANGVPETFDKYETSVELSERDARVFGKVNEVAHGHNISSAAMDDITKAIVGGMEAEEQAVREEDGIHQQTTERQLKETWQGDYQTNINMVQGLLSTLPEEIREEFSSARLMDGRAVFNSPEIMVFFSDMARKLDPSGTVVPNSANPVQTINDEIAALEARMGEDNWHKDLVANNRLVQLYEAQDKMAKQ